MISPPLRRRVATGLLFSCWLLASHAAFAGNASKGVDVYLSECSDCRSVNKGRNKKGPSLFGIVGRPAGTEQGYHYTDALKNTHWVWTLDKLRWYLSQPARKANPGTRMKYDGLDSPQQLDDLLGYLDTLH